MKLDGSTYTGLLKISSTASISNVTDEPATAADHVYTLDGIKLKVAPAKLPKGVYIVKGKKMVKR